MHRSLRQALRHPSSTPLRRVAPAVVCFFPVFRPIASALDADQSGVEASSRPESFASAVFATGSDE
jgi:hypothetical protein